MEVPGYSVLETSVFLRTVAWGVCRRLCGSNPVKKRSCRFREYKLFVQLFRSAMQPLRILHRCRPHRAGPIPEALDSQFARFYHSLIFFYQPRLLFDRIIIFVTLRAKH